MMVPQNQPLDQPQRRQSLHLQQPSQNQQQQTQKQQSHHQQLVNNRSNNPSNDADYEDDHGMRIGASYQAEIPQFIAYAPAPEYYEDEGAIRVWSPYNKIPDHILDEYINTAKEKYLYNTEQALGMLSWHRYDLNRAYADLPNFVPYPNEWSVEDKVLFEQAYQFHEKQFSKIRQMLPDKSMANLINYYYSWKKTRTKASLMERQTRKFAAKKNDDNGASDDDEIDEDNQAETNKLDSNDGKVALQPDQCNKESAPTEEFTDEPDVNCCSCGKQTRKDGVNTGVIVDGIVDNFCSECYGKWKNGGKKYKLETEVGDCWYHPNGETRRILFNYKDVLEIVRGGSETGDLMVRQAESVIKSTIRDIQSKKQALSLIQDKIRPIMEQISSLDAGEFNGILPAYKPTDKWTPDEISLGIQGLRRYGLDFGAISDILRTKSPEAIRQFYVSQKHRLNLEPLVSELERAVSLS